MTGKDKIVQTAPAGRGVAWLTAFALALLGVPLVIGGAKLIVLGGSFYYLIAGATLLAACVLSWRGERQAAWLYAAVTLGTIIWAVAEAGFDCWALVPRIALLAAFGVWFALPFVRRAWVHGKKPLGELGETIVGMAGPLLLAGAVALCGVSYVASTFAPVPPRTGYPQAGQITRGNEWPLYGNTARGDRFSPADQITRNNVGELKLAWSYRTGVKPPPGAPAGTKLSFEATPIKIGSSIYFCTPYNLVISLNADTGAEEWRFDPHVRGELFSNACRGVSYYAGSGTNSFCDSRILMTAIDNRLHALDASTGKHCQDFGKDGIVDLTVGMGSNPLGYQFATSPPLVIGDTVVLGGSHLDNQSTDELPGVIRAFDVHAGRLLWAWEVLEPGARKLEVNTTYPRDTPNAWSVFSADAELGLVYVPTGNAPPDFFGGVRSAAQDRYSSSIVALEATTGEVRWSFQTVHHDVWDFDLASQPVLVDIDTASGRRAALIAPTKRGEIFVLDRRTGEPIVPVVARPVPQRAVAGERLSPTQPFTVGFPSFSPPALTEADMWGVTMFDQLACRIAFRKQAYEGQFTPPSLEGSIVYPSPTGVINWGSVAVDPERQIMFVNASFMPFLITLVPRKAADAAGIKPWDIHPKEIKSSRHEKDAAASRAAWAQMGTPYAAITEPFLSPLKFPCHRPPWGTIAAVDLKTNRLLWEKPFGTTRDAAPLGLPLPVGVFNHGGAVVTRAGLAFIGATMDNYIRAIDIETGEELWKARLLAGGQATPMSYVSQGTGRQYVVIAAGGHEMLQTKEGDYVLAYALSKP